jgi:hypothetical protein
MMNRILIFIVFSCVVASSSSGQDFPKAMKKVFTGNQYKNYQWANYPLDDYGVGTAYRGTSAEMKGGSFLCATFTCLDVAKPDPTKADGLTEWLIVSSDPKDSTGYANKGCGGNVETSLQTNSKWAVSAIVPQLLGVLGLNATASNDKSVKTNLVAASACNRKLLQVKALQYISRTDHPDTYGVRDAYKKNELVIVLEDVVITSFDVQVNTTGDLKAAFDAKLAQDPTGKIGNNASLQFNLEKTSSDSYHLKTSTPLIVGFLAASNHKVLIGKGAGPGEIGNWAGWEPMTVATPQK